MPREITHHDEVIEAIGSCDLIAELLEKHEDQFKHELDLEIIVYGRNYAEQRVGPYARLLVYEPGEEIIREGSWRGNTFYILVDGKLDVYVKDEHGESKKENELLPHKCFGEMSLLAGQPSTATIVVSPTTEARVLEIQRPALRLLRKLEKFRHSLDKDYRNHGLDCTLIEVEEGAKKSITDLEKATKFVFSEELFTKLKDAARFTVYAKDHILFREGDPINRLVFIRSGWARRVRAQSSSAESARRFASNPKLADMVMGLPPDVGLDFLGAGNWLGLEKFTDGDQTRWSYTATIMARTEVMEVAVSRLKADPELADMIDKYFQRFSDADNKPPEPPRDKRSAAAFGKEISTGIVDGTNLLVMDMDLCIRCGNCSLACHKIHGQSRLLRRGIHIERPVRLQSKATKHILAPSVCLHCQDPECLTGCPTGAIGRFSEGYIDIDPMTCIGCADCATQCPYDAISMIPRKPDAPPPLGLVLRLKSWLSLAPPTVPPQVTETEDMLAVKCNLCKNTQLNPPGAKKQAYSCQESCPTGALVRVNPKEYFSEAKNSIGIIFKDQTHAIGRNIHKRDTPALILHIVGVLAIITITWAGLWAVRRYTLDAHLGGTWLTMRWITGLVGLGGIACVLTYPARKQIYRRRAGPLRYWLQGHVYLGLIVGVVLLIHGSRESGGLLTSMLMVSLDVVIVAGLFGISCYIIVPRIMTSIEGEPLLIEDLRARRQELRETLSLIDTSDDEMCYLVKVKMRKRFFSFSYLLRQYVRREKLTKLLAEAREEFQEDAERLRDSAAYNSLMEAVEATATIRRVDSLIYLHQLLKLWLAPHVVSASIMLALMTIHIINVVLFTVR